MSLHLTLNDAGIALDFVRKRFHEFLDAELSGSLFCEMVALSTRLKVEQDAYLREMARRSPQSRGRDRRARVIRRP